MEEIGSQSCEYSVHTQTKEFYLRPKQNRQQIFWTCAKFKRRDEELLGLSQSGYPCGLCFMMNFIVHTLHNDSNFVAL